MMNSQTEATPAQIAVIAASQYVASAVRPDQYPEKDLPQIAFIGRSNVGKSSLINSLCNRRNLARTSGAPGKTQTINFYEVDAKLANGARLYFHLVDLPGYGYAKRGLGARREWAKFTEEYWLKSDKLKLIFQLIDLRHPPMQSDVNVYQWFLSHNLPVVLVGTKADKISKGQLKKHISQIAAALGLELGPGLGEKRGGLIAHSASTGLGREDILHIIAHILVR